MNLRYLNNFFSILLVTTGFFLSGQQTFAKDPTYARPSLTDPRMREEKPEPGEIQFIRFLTTEDYPPFSFLRSDGELSGFNVDLARAVCDELKLACSIQAWRWDQLDDALAKGAGDAIISSRKLTRTADENQIFSIPYYLTPARFVTLRSSDLDSFIPEKLKSRKIGTIGGSAHEAFLKAAFSASMIRPFPSLAEAEAALIAGDIDTLFADGVTLSIWLAESGGQCCAFRGGPYLDSHYFGEGGRIVFRRDNQNLRAVINAALHRLDGRGVTAELYWKYFPAGFYENISH